MTQQATELKARELPWWREVTAYQWVVLLVACAGWIFDIYENQIFAVVRGNMLGQLLGNVPANSPEVKQAGDMINSLFLVGGAIGGVAFGMIADRYGRGRAMVLSILVYASFSALTAAAQSVWQVAVLRFLVATGTGGEWAVAAALVSEVFPKRARAHASGIFHASSILGGVAAASAGILTGSNWRLAFLIGLAPALLVFVVRLTVRDSRQQISPDDADASTIETGPAQPHPTPRLAGSLASRSPLSPSPGTPGEGRGEGSPQLAYADPATRTPSHGFSAFWLNPTYRTRALLGLLLAGIGLIGYWGVYVAGQDLAREFLLSHGTPPAEAETAAKKAYGFYQMIGGAVGLFSMGPLCALLGRRTAFVVMQLGAIAIAPVLCFTPTSYPALLTLLAVMAFFVNGMHAGYAVWFPELFPAHLRATGSGICFNGARLLAAPALALSGFLKSHFSLPLAITILSLVYLPGLVVALLLPETRPDRPAST